MLRLRLEAIPRGHGDSFRGSERARLSSERNIRQATLTPPM